MTLQGFLAIFVSWCMFAFYSYSQYSHNIRSSNYFIVIGVLYGILGNILWVFLAKNLSDNSKIIMHAVMWDAGLAVIGFAIPAIMLRKTISGYSYLGLSLVMVGTIITIVAHNFDEK